MNLYLFITGLFTVLLLAGLGFAIKYRKAYWLINGYNMLSEEKKKNMDTEGLGRFLGNCLFAIAGLVAASFACFLPGWTTGGLIALGLLLPFIVFMAVRAQKFYGREKREGFMQGRTKLTIALLIVVLGGAAAGVALLINDSAKPIEYIIADGSLRIKCSFGETVKLADVGGLELTQAKPDIAERTWGSAMGDKLRGSFSLSGGKAARIFMENATPPFIHFTAGGREYYLNGMTPEDTKKLYGELSDMLKQ